MDRTIESVPLEKATRLLNHGPTVLVSSRHGGVANVMAAAWACALDYTPPKLTVVLDKSSATRGLVEKSGTLVVQVPNVSQLDMTYRVGHSSLSSDPDKLAACGVELFDIAGAGLPFVSGCSAWLACKVMPEPHNEQTYDLFIAEIIGAWADTRVFKNGHWNFEQADPSWRSLHYIAGGHFLAIGEAFNVG
ncbi:MAG: flavin reductase [Comamonadaceae bacterium]|nr:MAG: flavin reductase [Comamonadaceae bacterium]